eukprot:CAMPEP_0184367182 /NCGR_PEP_ID=MMETSP1089-20130417/157318_1 /TAXON_ID=38269 ORGANISM="Gloeochaete wittrockiana, Strain SAG46.84" /NCGR_SAMPLE_ID=MMETSP1089 /ASSEMBLY_ACC=CAM_ASM_000445 /LENGTH=48 /DNA_ID= /DNA_START= /DNA_END= /DNA_ORIENTATION=
MTKAEASSSEEILRGRFSPTLLNSFKADMPRITYQGAGSPLIGPSGGS